MIGYRRKSAGRFKRSIDQWEGWYRHANYCSCGHKWAQFERVCPSCKRKHQGAKR